MSEAPGGGLIPVSDEQAKALQEGFKLGQEGVSALKAFGGYFGKILGSLPEDLVGLLGADRVRARRFENMLHLAAETKARLEASGIRDPQAAPLSIALPLLEYAADESRQELVDLWARLLAAAMDPARTRRVRQTFVDAVKAMDPVDALVLHQMPIGNVDGSAAEYLARIIKASGNEAQISLQRLVELGCIRDRDARPGAVVLSIERPVLTPFGIELLAVLRA